MTIRIVTDSTADVPADLAARLDLTVIPCALIIEGQSLRDGLDLSRADFYSRLPSLADLPTTAAPSAGAFEEAYKTLANADHLVSIHAASALSGIYNAARLAAEKFGARVAVIDSGQISMGLGWQVIAAGEAAAAGQPLDAVRAAIDSVRRRVRVIALLDTLEYARRSGRVSWLRAGLGSILQVKPMMALAEGRVIKIAETRTWGKAIARFVALVQSLGPLERLAVMHSNRAADAAAVLGQLADAVSGGKLIVEATTVVGTHVGPGAVAVAAVTKEELPA